MRFQRLWGSICAAASLLAGATPGEAQQGGDPFVFVSERPRFGLTTSSSGDLWYSLPMEIRPTGSSVASVPLSAINAHLEQRQQIRPSAPAEPWCYANALSERSFISASRRVQQNIEQVFRENPDHHFQLRGRFTGAGELVATVGHFEKCAGGTGSFILITDPASTPHRVVFVDVLPYESGLQYMRLLNGGITVSTCFWCGDVMGLFYDARRQTFYWEALGD